VWARRADPDDLGQGFLAAMAVAGDGSGTVIPAGMIQMLISGRHRDSRYGAEVNVL
jgi:hypothetical protein